jgi:hypothetical protein
MLIVDIHGRKNFYNIVTGTHHIELLKSSFTRPISEADLALSYSIFDNIFVMLKTR